MVTRGMAAVWDGVGVEVLGPRPPVRPPLRTRNDDSVVLALRYGEIVLLLTGDVEAAGEAAMDPPRSFAVKVAHHGSRSSSDAGSSWPRRAPRVAVVSVGDHSRFGHPHPEVVARYQRAGVRLFRTDRDGAVTLSTDGKSVWMTTFAGWLGGSYSLTCANIRLLPAIRSRPPSRVARAAREERTRGERACLQGMSEDKKPFTVSDRRHFTPEGEVRKSDADEATPEARSAAGRQPPRHARPRRAAARRRRRRDPPTAAAPAPTGEAEAGPGGEHGGRYPSDLLGLLISLGAQASMLLMGGPEGEPPDLDGARSLIELLGVLKEKTEGRRTPQEDQLVEGLLYELRMAFVQATKAAGR